jgi:hypothetical protein
MSSHREAPEISKDPVADSTDVYAFVSPDKPDTVTLIANYIPLEDPAGGPNFFEFGDDVLYKILIDNDGDGYSDITYEFHFTTEVSNPNTFLYNTGPIATLDSANWNRKQFYEVTRVERKGGREKSRKLLGKHLASPPCNVGPRSTPNYDALAAAAVHQLDNGTRVFAGQRLDGFYVDLGSIFDLGDLRPFQNLHLIPTAAAEGVDALRAFNVHSIALQIPIKDLTRNKSVPSDPTKPESVIGVWTTASRQKGKVRADCSDGNDRQDHRSGGWVQVSRLGNPLFNEVIVPMAKKDYWNKVAPDQDSKFLEYVQQPELAKLIPVLYPGVFPNLGARTADRADLVAILLTGIPNGVVPGLNTFTGPTYADMLRLNVAIKPSSSPNILGVVGGDLAGFPNGRRVSDDVVTIELRAIAGATIPLVDPTYTPDGAAAAVTDGVTPPGNVSYSASFPYLDNPKNGYEVQPLKAAS